MRAEDYAAVVAGIVVSIGAIFGLIRSNQEDTQMAQAKVFWKSKTFWAQAFDAAKNGALLVGMLTPAAPVVGAVGLIVNAATIGSRIVATGPLSVLKDAAKE